MSIRIAQFNVLENGRLLNYVGASGYGQLMETAAEDALGREGAATCQEVLNMAGQALGKAKELEVAEKTHSKILEDRRNRLFNTAEMLDDELEKRSEDEMPKISGNVQYKSCTQRLVRLLFEVADPELAGRAHEALIEANIPK